MKVVFNVKDYWEILKEAGLNFIDNNGIKLSASLSYYTIFSLPPLSIIIIYTCGYFFGADAVSGQFFNQINGLVGNAAALQIQEAIKNIELSDNNNFAAIIGSVLLLFGASGIFAEIQSSINLIWKLKAKPKKGILKFFFNRLMSFSMIAVVGFLLLVSLILNTLLDLFSGSIFKFMPDITAYLLYAINLVFVFLITTFLFTFIFRTLPDGNIVFRDAFIGGSVTSLFFIIGKFIIGLYIGNSDVANLYGAAGSIVVILVWVYYSAIILYFGAEFTKSYANRRGNQITPNQYAVFLDN